VLEPVPGLNVIARGTPVPGAGSYLLQRNENVIGVFLEGPIVDAVSDAWRGDCQKSFDADGYPQFGYVDATRAKVAQSLAIRMRSAAFMRTSAGKMKSVFLVAAEANVSFVMRAIMRAAGVGNVHLIEPAAASMVLPLISAGRDPLAEGVRSA
jgi:hypothetical protein